jgi:hypothetical protein
VESTLSAAERGPVHCEKQRMKPVETPEGLEAVKDSVRGWRPWQRKQFELFKGTAISTPAQRHFSRGYFLLVSIQSGITDNQYRNTRASDQGAGRRSVCLSRKKRGYANPGTLLFSVSPLILAGCRRPPPRRSNGSGLCLIFPAIASLIRL